MEKPTGVIQKIIESLQQVNALDVYSPIEKDIILHNLRAAYMIFLNVTADETIMENRVEKLVFEYEAEELIINNGQLTIDNGELIIDNGQLTIDNGELIIDNEEGERVEEPIEENPEPIFIDEPIEIIDEPIEENPEPLFVEEPLIEIIDEPIEENPEPLFVEEPLIEIIDETIEENPEPLFIDEPIEIIDETIEENPEPLFIEAPLVEEIIEETPKPLFIEAPLVEEIIETPKPLFIEAPLVEEIIETPKPLFIEAPLVAEIPQDDILEFIPDAKPQSGLLFEDISVAASEKKSLNDLLIEKKEDHSLGTRFQQSFIPDLTKAIAINEKFTFIRELFRNSGVDFSNAIQKLNECENIEAAFILMEEFKHQYLWDTTSTSYLSLCDLVRRRFL